MSIYILLLILILSEEVQKTKSKVMKEVLSCSDKFGPCFQLLCSFLIVASGVD